MYTMSVVIRAAKKNDLSSVATIGKIHEFQLANGEYMDAKTFSRFLKSDLFFVAEQNKKIIGFLLGEQLFHANGAMLWFIAVQKEKRDQGIGQKLLEYFESKCNQKKLEFILLYSPTTSKKAIHFYTKNHYKKGNKSFFELLKIMI